MIDSPSESCTANEVALTWNQTGPPGPPGPAATKLFARLRADGSVDVASSTVLQQPSITGRTGAGAYQVAFTQPVDKCVPVATVHPQVPVDTAIPTLLAEVGYSSQTQVTVLVRTPAGPTADSAFDLIVMC